MENRDDGASVVGVNINGERVKEGITGRGWDVVSIVKRHIAERMSEIDSRNSPSALVISYWREI